MTRQTLVVFSLLTFSAEGAWAQEMPGKDEVEVVSTAMSGSGCGAGEEGGDTIELASSTEEGAFDQLLIRMAKFKAERPGTARQFCQVTVDLAYPDGWQYSLAGGTIVGRSELSKRVKAELKIEMGFADQDGVTTSKTRKEKGFVSSSYFFRDEFGRALWSSCGNPSPLQVSFTASLRGPTKNPSSFTVRGHATNAPFQLVWRRCS